MPETFTKWLLIDVVVINDQVSVEDLLKGIIASGNDAYVALAEDSWI